MRAHHLDDLTLLSLASSVAYGRPRAVKHLKKCAPCQERQRLLASLMPVDFPDGGSVPEWPEVNPIRPQPVASRPVWPWVASGAAGLVAALVLWPYALWATPPSGLTAASILLFGKTQTMQVIQGRGHVAIRYARQGNWALVQTRSLSTLPQGRVYEAWWITGTQHRKVTVFYASRDGSTSIWIRHNTPLATVNALGITVEPTPGTKKPTGPKEFFLKFPPSS